MMCPYHLAAFAFSTTFLPLVVFTFLGRFWDVYWGVVYAPYLLLMTIQAAIWVETLDYSRRREDAQKSQRSRTRERQSPRA
jgi:4-amino-4-deoxy-L-arabinose transferase-like glycosyltransferase